MNQEIMTAHNLHPDITVLSNDFIDRYLNRTDGEYIKVYLMILRLENSGIPATAEELADRLELTRKDILRALSYWQKEGLLSERKETGPEAEAAPEDDGTESALQAADGRPARDSIPFKRTLTPLEIEAASENRDLSRVIFMAETYFGKTFSVSELNSLCYISSQLAFSSELMEHLIEYCVSKGHTSMRYVERVAIEWFRQGIRTVPEAREHSRLYEKNVYPVIRAFGLTGRSLGASEMEYIERWNRMGFDTDLITAACSKTILSIHQASFPYASKILDVWKAKGVRTLKDVEALDEAHAGARVQEAKKVPASGGSQTAFDQRSYDYGALEARLLDRDRRKP